MTDMADEAYIHYLDCRTNSDVSIPDKFSYNKWDIGEETVSNWIKTKGGVTNPPLSYVICESTNPLTMDHSELIIYNTSLTTEVFKDDSKKVANLLTHIVLDTDAFEWVGRNFTQSKERSLQWICRV